MILEMNDIRKSFGGLEVLRGIDISVGKGETVSVIGPSGSGKSTLLRCATFLETADSGEIKYMGNKAAWTDETGKMKYVSPSELKKFKSCFGLVFQQFNLFPHFTVLKNIIDAPVSVQKRSRDEVTEEAMAILEKMGLASKANEYPGRLSGGQQQRVAIGRALITKPKLILADEPTGNLDSKNSQDVIALLTQASRRYQQTILMITHNKDLTASVDRVFRVSDGVLTDLGGKTNEALS